MPVHAETASSSQGAARELLSGIDSLDLTCKVPAPVRLLEELAELKAAAGESPREAVVFTIGDDSLRVASSGMGQWWPFRLDHKFGQLGITGVANRPAWRISAAAEALHVQGVGPVIEFWRSIIEALTGSPAMLLASRLDVHADFAGLGIVDEDRPAFLCKSGRQSVEFDHGNLETLYFGKGGELMVRIYDKLAEVQAKGQGGYLLGAYGQAGLREGETVQRVEAQIRGRTLRQLEIATAEDAVRRCGAVYAYVTGKWLRLVEASGDSNKSRRSLDPRWSAVQAASIAAGIDPARRVIAERHAPALDTITANVAGWALRAGEVLGVDDFATAWHQLGLLVGG